MAILVTGGAGFIGSHLCDSLIKKNKKVIAFDDLSTGSMDNISQLIKEPDFQFIKGSICDYNEINEIIIECDMIYHLGASVGVKLVVDKPLESLENNVVGTENVLKSALKGNKKVLITSSSEVYGKNNNVPFSEDNDRVFGSVFSNRWGYALSKSMDEFLAINYYTEKNLETVVVRLFNTVGPRQTGEYGMVIPRLVKQALNNNDLTIYGTGKQSRCFTHVNDVVSGLINLMESNKSSGQVFNIGSNDEITIIDLANKIKMLTNSNSKIRFLNYNEVYGKNFEDMQRRLPNISKISNLINFKPQKNIDKIIMDVRDYIISK
ncbi:MAG: nucleoside-diphosphate sugar epimerase [Candidatus Marinimicrobia bacterium]|nr:nucleoside-diphosphate sugar epimerase [Candidatus Neomarinimicrobiota bacterium]|tara:strand:- start:644 stop:1606 length:963 start_codon:yes stop_codon:yes gene_type:complete